VAGGSNKQQPPDDVVIAEIVKPRGIRGEVACTLYTDFPERFEELNRVTLRWPDGRRSSMEIEGHWFYKGRIILKFSGCDSMSAAEALVGGQLVVPESQSRSLNDQSFYEYRLVGAEIVTVDGVVVGRVDSILRTGATDVLVVKAADSRERLIPFADDICIDVDMEARRITIDPPQGLLEL
jgi:16S rRNA processing protein RimM